MPKSRVTIVGLGFIGGSMGLALKKSKLDVEIIGHDKDSSVAARAHKRGAVDATKWNLIDACDGAGLIVLALPIDGVKSTLAALQPHLAPGVIVTDTATTKTTVLEWAASLPAGVEFIGGDPVIKADYVGANAGIDAADAEIFKDTTYCIVPSKTSAAQAVDTLASFATILGAKPYFIDAAEHDGLMAAVQHLPALLATVLLAATARSDGWREMSKVAGADYRTATGVAPADAAAAREQFLAHRSDLVRWIDAVSKELHDLREMLDRQDAAALEALVDGAAVERTRWLRGRQEGEGASTEWQAVRLDPMRLFLGGLTDRTPRKKE